MLTNFLHDSTPCVQWSRSHTDVVWERDCWGVVIRTSLATCTWQWHESYPVKVMAHFVSCCSVIQVKTQDGDVETCCTKSCFSSQSSTSDFAKFTGSEGCTYTNLYACVSACHSNGSMLHPTLDPNELHFMLRQTAQGPPRCYSLSARHP